MILRLDHRLHNAEYLAHYLALDQLRQYFESASIGSVMDSLSSSTLLGLPMLVPPMQEQASIAAFVSRERAAIDDLVADAQRAINLLQERRTALISAAVTGQIDVRDLVPPEAA
jgi:type I restriction enzyme S subunit